MKAIFAKFVLYIIFSTVLCCASENLYNEKYNINYFTFVEKNGDEVSLAYRQFKTEAPKAVIVFLSGLQSHSQWFNDTGGELNEKGFSVYAFDRRGSGLSSGLKGDIKSYKTWLRDLNIFINFVKLENPNLKIHLMANCFGARIALGHEILYPGFIDSLILLAPGTEMKADFYPAEKAFIALAKGLNPKHLIHVPLKDEMFTNDREYLSFIASDKNAVRQATARLYIQAENLRKLIKKNLIKITLPVLILLSGNDVVVNNKKIETELFNKLGEPNNLIINYPDASHYLFFEPVSNLVLDDISSWIMDF